MALTALQRQKFFYKNDIVSTLAPWRDRLAKGEDLTVDDLDRIIAVLSDRDRDIEDYLETDEIFEQSFQDAVQAQLDFILNELSTRPVYAEVLTSEGTSSTTYTDLATTGPTATVTIGTSGIAVVISSAITTVSATNTTGSFGISVDGGAVVGTSGFVHNFVNGSGGSGACTVRRFTGLSPGSHTFQHKYLCSLNTSTATFANRSLMVFPY